MAVYTLEWAGPSAREAIVHHSFHGAFAVRRGRWKLVTSLGSGGFSKPASVEPVPDGPRGELYDLESDPGETENLWLQRPDVVTELEALLENIREHS